jgi:hypothetical protein
MSQRVPFAEATAEEGQNGRRWLVRRDNFRPPDIAALIFRDFQRAGPG